MGRGGVRVYETETYTEIARDDHYGDATYWVAFDRRNRLVTASYDGHVRLYDSPEGPFKPNAKVKPAPGGRPFSAAFSPDGSRIAVGYDNSTRVDVLSADDLSVLFTANPAGENGNLAKVAWSRDGHYLYAAGQHDDGDGRNIIRRWAKGGRGASTDLAVSDDTVMTLVPLKAGRLALGAEDPLVAMLGADGNPVWVQDRKVPDFRGQRGAESIRLSHHADIVRFGFKQRGEDPAQFSMGDASLRRDVSGNPGLSGAVTEADGLAVTDWVNTVNPKVNGRILVLESYERSRSLAVAPDGAHFLLGADWHLRHFDRDGDQVWAIVVPGVAWAVNLAGNGKVAVAGFGDGTLRWFRLEDGEELLALFVDPRTERWIAWTPQGYYHASAGAENLIGWHLNNGPEEAPEFFGASRFRDRFSRPDVIARVLQTLDVEDALAQADKARGEMTVKRDVRSLRPPVISIAAPAPGTKISDTKLVLTYQTKSPAGPVASIEARVDGRPTTVLERDWAKGEITISVPERDSTVSLIAVNANGRSEPANLEVKWEGRPDWRKPRLYVLAIGVSEYSDSSIENLVYADQDAEDFVKAIKRQQGGLYKEVVPMLRRNHEATRSEVLDGLDWLRSRTGPRDLAILFLSGHGRTERGRYIFLPHDADISRFESTSIKGSDFKEYLGDIAGKAIMFNDTCRGGAVLAGQSVVLMADMDRVANEFVDANPGVVVLSSSTGRQPSKEDPKWKNGAFTEALIEAIGSVHADYDEDGLLTIVELELYLSVRVKALTGGKQKPVTTKPQAVENYEVVRVLQRQ